MAKKKEELKSITELAVINPSLKESLAKFENVKTQLEMVAKSCLLIKVTDESSLSVCESNLTKVNDLCKAVEKFRIEEKAPHFERCKAIDAAAAYVVDLPESAVSYLKDEKKNYILKIEAEKKRLEALQSKVDVMAEYMKKQYESIDTIDKLDAFVVRIGSIKFKETYQDYEDKAYGIAQAYINLFSSKRAELEVIESGNPEEIEAIQQASLELQESIQETIVENKVEAIDLFEVKKIRRPWKAELVDINKVPKEWLMLDESKVKEWMKANSENLVDGQTLNGVKFFKDLTITA